MRSYSKTALSTLTRDLRAENYQWQIGEDNRALRVLPITYLVGFPRTQSAKTA
jgi:hypothetical protein